jgi:hypothetical protein
MDPATWLAHRIDPVIIAPYRWFEEPMTGFWIGTLILSAWCLLFGELTLLIGYALTHRHVREANDEMVKHHNLSMDALEAGDKEAYRVTNQLANEAFGHAFFRSLAVGMASLWPLFMAAHWLSLRFPDARFSLAGLLDVNFLGPLLVCYLVVRIAYGRVRHRIPLLRNTARLAKKMEPAEKLRLPGEGDGG